MRVVIIGGGFGGLSVARGLTGAEGIEVTLIDKRNFHLFQPLLYQVATGGLSPANIAAPLRSVISAAENVTVLLGEVTSFDLDGRRISLEDGTAVDYDILVVAAGSRFNYFGHPEWERHAPALKTIEDALTIRARMVKSFEQAEKSEDPREIETCLTFVVVGGGPTGVEMAGAIGEFASFTLKHDFRSIRTRKARVILLEALDRVLPPYPPSLSEKALESLNDLGVEAMTGAKVTNIDGEGVTIERDDKEERIEASTVVWAAGVLGSPLGETLAKAAGVELERGGKLRVGKDLSIPGHPDVFVIGDLAHLEQNGKPLPALAPVALQQGSHLAANLVRRQQGQPSLPFKFSSRGTMATIGRAAAVVQIGPLKLWGRPGWFTWLLVHLFSLPRFENRILVFVQWAWNYITHRRSARLITHDLQVRKPEARVTEKT